MNCERCHQPGAQTRHLSIALDGASPTQAQFTLCADCADIGAGLEPIEGVTDFLTGTTPPRLIELSITVLHSNGCDWLQREHTTHYSEGSAQLRINKAKAFHGGDLEWEAVESGTVILRGSTLD